MTDYGHETEKKIKEVVDACSRYGERSIIALAGVPGTGKSFIGCIAAQRFASDPLMVREIQFHQSYTYEEFIEGMRIGAEGAVTIEPGVFLEWNDRAKDDPERKYVLLVEELTRANLAAVLGELMTYVEHRDRPFTTVYNRQPVKVAKNLIVLATYNPTDRSAIDIDVALLRRIRIIQCLPSVGQLREMLKPPKSNLPDRVIRQLGKLFDECSKQKDYEHLMPFGHGMFAGVQEERPDLHELWQERIRHVLYRPLVEPAAFAEIIERNYPWKDPTYAVPESGGEGADLAVPTSNVATQAVEDSPTVQPG